MRLDWLTDPHLDHLRDEEMLLAFVKKLHSRPSDGLLITGDIAEGPTIYEFLGLVSGAYQRPVYFVLGNHDFFGGFMSDAHQEVRTVCRAVPQGILNWMTDRDFIMLDETTALVGHDGFYDGQAGQAGLTFSLPDFFLPGGNRDLIQALELGSRHLFRLLERLGRESAAFLRTQIQGAIRYGARRVLVITHVPPFRQASYFRGRPSEPHAVPFYVNQILGEELLELAGKFPNVKIEVYAGHTHCERVYEAADNLVVHVGRARYERLPTFQQPIVI